ncbi:MAG TPA: hypothetical protein VE988_00540 [Gemmataceae bacterium]|nr:hypothetical protein [Gemmataceae bacterium]
MDHRLVTSAQITPRLECQGFEAGDIVLPSFKLHAGESLCLHVEHGHLPWYETLLPLLKGEVIHSGLRIHGVVRYLERPMPARGWFGRRKDLSARDWLVLEKHVPLKAALAILDCVHIPQDLRIGWMGWNERTMLALEFNLFDPPDVLLFDTGGNDPLGVLRVFDRLATRPKTLTLVYLKYINGPGSPCLVGGQCLDVAARPTEAALVE